VSEPWTAAELRALIIRTAEDFVAGKASIRDMRNAVFQDLPTLCEDHPLDDDLIDLFEAVDKWDSSWDIKRPEVEAEALASARVLVDTSR
jgi:hypothetical protein